MNDNPQLPNLTQDYDQGLASAREFVKRMGPERAENLRVEYTKLTHSADPLVRVNAAFTLLGLLAAMEAVRLEGQE